MSIASAVAQTNRPNSVTPSELSKVIEALWPSKKPLFLEGPPGIGKSAIPRQFCERARTIPAIQEALKEMKSPYFGRALEFCDVRTLLHNPADFSMPFPDTENKTYTWVNSLLPSKRRQPDWVGIIMLDELTQCAPMLQSVTLQILHERRCGSDEIPDGAWVIGAGNRPKDGTASHKLITSAANRMIILELLVDSLPDGAWQRWARENDVHAIVRYYLAKCPDKLMVFDPNNPDPSQPTPRSWGELASDIMKYVPEELHFQLLAGAIGEAEAVAFLAFTKIAAKVPDPMDILADADNFKPPSDLAILYATCAALSSIAKGMELRKVDVFAQVALKMPKEFGIMLMKDIVVHHPQCVQPKHTGKHTGLWLTANRNVLVY